MSTIWNIVDEKLIEAYVVLVMSDRATLSQSDISGKKIVPIKYCQEVEVRIALKTVEVLG